MIYMKVLAENRIFLLIVFISLVALLALELNPDLLVLLSDVEGHYTGPPSDPQSEIIHTNLYFWNAITLSSLLMESYWRKHHPHWAFSLLCMSHDMMHWYRFRSLKCFGWRL
ncbi:uncharacterized protein LOC107018808 [Solanum pennellii]|uniref:Uncharacterized protein LOC107018808 n=1 Tax=Solanum pennellii TaxID=28526 RepID=A0ABM1GRK2_SOLPN|nr:uncharacterized protein LOC107018808 [Solanum pennellii]